MKELKIEDYSKIKEYLDLANYEGYNSNFITMMMWNHEYHIEYEIHQNFMVMLHNYKGERFWAMPFTDENHYHEAIEYMVQYSHEHQFEFSIDCAIEEFVNKIKATYKDDLIFIRTPHNDDYIYDRKMLETLSGKKMQKRRNHYNSFIKEYPNYIYRDLDLINDYDTIFSCLSRWEQEKDGISESMTSEIRGIMYLLSSQHLLDFKVGGIFINGQMEAFIIASLLKHSTIQIHVEKANKEIRGLYPAILKELLEHHFPDEIFVNREEDMGLDNLKKSKQALHPVKMIKKYRICKRNTSISQASENDRNQITELWKNCFKDETEASTLYYFDNLYQTSHTYVLKNINHIITAMQIVPFHIYKSKQEISAYFILGVCTDPNYQNQGFMKELLSYVLNLYQGQVFYLQAYKPDIYRKFGFHASHHHQLIKVDREKYTMESSPMVNQDYSLLQDYYDAFTEHFDEYRIRDSKYWKLLIKRCLAFGDEIIVFEREGYVIYNQDDNNIHISEIIYTNENHLNEIISYFCKFNKTIIIECDMKAKIHGDITEIITMMSNQNKNDCFDSNKYINEVY